MDRCHMKRPFYGSRRMVDWLADEGHRVNRKRVQRLMRTMGLVYLVAVMDWYSRKVLSWRLSNTMDSHFCARALEEALEDHGIPQIVNTDQGSQFTSEAFIEVLKGKDIQISMDGKGRWLDNVFIERLWRSVKYEEVYLKAYTGVADARRSLACYVRFYNQHRRHQALDIQTPDEVYYQPAYVKAA